MTDVGDTASPNKLDVSEPQKRTELSGPQLQNALWRAVVTGRPRELLKFFQEQKGHPRLPEIINVTEDDYDEDGGNVLIYCVREGRDKGSVFGGKDYGQCISTLVEHGVDIDFKDKGGKTALSWAVTLKYTNYVGRLLKLGADIALVDQDGLSPFHIAVHKGLKEIASAMLDKDPEIADVKNGQGVPPLVIAVKQGHQEMCRLLLQYGADVNAAEDKNKRTPVYHAIRNKRLDVLDILLKYKPNLTTLDCEGRSILYLLCETSDVRYFHKVISQCPHFPPEIMEKTDDDGQTPLIVACKNGNAEQVKHLLEEGTSVCTKDHSGKTALHHCADNLETQCAEMLLDKDPSVLEEKDEQGYTVLTLAVLVGNDKLMTLLLDRKANLQVTDNEGHLLTHWAAVCGQLKVLDILVQHGADLSSADHHHAYPIHYAAQMNPSNSGNSDSRISEKVLKKLIACKVALDVVDDAERQPLLWAACSGNAESCKLLLKAGADINSRDRDQLTALHCAASRGHHQCIEVLRKAGADVNLEDSNKCTPLFYAITLGNLQCTKALIAAKADVNHIDERGRNPVHCAAIKGCADTVKLLEKEKSDLWHQNKKGDYPVHEAALKGHIEVVKFLLRQKNDKDAVNVTNNLGKTLLHIAAATNNLPLCKLLINQDCDKNALMKHAVKGSGGKEFTPYDIAVIKEYKEAAEYLRSKGALPYADLSNVEKRQSKSARSRKQSKVEPVIEEEKVEEKNNKKSPSKTPVKKTPAKKEKKKVKGDNKSKKEKSDEKKDSDVVVSREEDKENIGKEITELVVVDQNEGGDKVEEKPRKKSASPERKREKSASPDRKRSASVRRDRSRSGSRGRSPAKSPADINRDDERTKARVLPKKPNADSVLDREDGIRTSRVSLRSEDSPIRDADTEEWDSVTSPIRMGGSASKQRKSDEGKYISLDRIDPKSEEIIPTGSETLPRTSTREGQRDGRRSKVGFSHKEYEDSGNETDHSRSKSRHTIHSIKSSGKPYIDSVRRSVMSYQTKRSTSRGMQQLKRAQIHTGPMHDIVMFSKMMDNYRKGLMGEEEEMDLRNYANWDGYLNETSSSKALLPRIVPNARSKEQHTILEMEAKTLKQETVKHCEDMEQQEEFQRKRNQDIDKEIDNLAARTAEMFDGVSHVAKNSVQSAKFRNTKLRDDMVKSREERLVQTTDPQERDLLERHQLEEQLIEEQAELDAERKERLKNWHRRKDEDMRRRLLQAYKPYFPNDVFSKKSVCVSGGRIKSAGRLRVDPTPSPRPRRGKTTTPRPASHASKSDHNSNYSVAQYRVKDEKRQVQMTPYGLRRVRNNDRPTYDEVECELADAIFFNADRCTRSADLSANWSRKYDGSIRPRTGLVFVEPHVYDDLVKEEKEAKQQISSEVRQHLASGTSGSVPNGHGTAADSYLS
ncbi:ankycorbin-like isoform X3 [Mya arenaria]|uniref:ankycorbin-like isoform X3 n=1 Tax=Mya arenaria TaxID=6604 RepID=UPI0022E56083|nr:ankycorbin-like isoform X3 [Mya arenaria]